MPDSLFLKIPAKTKTFLLTECMPYLTRWAITVHYTFKTFMVAEKILRSSTPSGYRPQLINDVNQSLLRTSFAFLAPGRKCNAARDATGLSITLRCTATRTHQLYEWESRHRQTKPCVARLFARASSGWVTNKTHIRARASPETNLRAMRRMVRLSITQQSKILLARVQLFYRVTHHSRGHNGDFLINIWWTWNILFWAYFLP